MRALYVLRHAKSSWGDQALPDHERPLAPRGREATRRLAAYITKEGLRPQLVLCSSALRARQTYEPLRAALGYPEVSVEEELYGASSEELLRRVQQVPEGLTRLLVVGHNPGLGELVASLAGDGERAALAKLREGFPTGALATLVFDTAWVDIGPGQGYLQELVVPRMLPAAAR